MKEFEKLEQGIRRLISSNHELQVRSGELRKENEMLMAQNKQLESSLMKETGTAKRLSDETEKVKNSIEGLLESIDSFESPSQ